MIDPTSELADQIQLCRSAKNPMDRFNSVILQRGAYWKAQREIGRAMADPSIRRICVKSGHMTGKDYTAAGLTLGWLTMHRDSGVVIVGPTLDQVRRSTWKEIRRAKEGSPLLRSVGRMTRSPMRLQYEDGWEVNVIAADKPEGVQGFHPSGPVLAITGESSFLNDPDLDQAIQSLKPVKRLDIFNPIRSYGEVYEACQRAVDDPTIRVITIPSTDSPDIGIEHSSRGLADAAWLRGMIADYGIGTRTYNVRVGAEFPDDGFDLLIPSDWLDRCGLAVHRDTGDYRLAIDLGLGNGGDDSTALVRDENGIRWFESSKYRSLEESARRAKYLSDHFSIRPSRISWDAAGIGADFDRRLRDVGLIGCMPYKGGKASKDKKFNNLRTASHFAMRRRLDPTRRNDDGSIRPIFHIPREFMVRFRRECRELTYESGPKDESILRNAEEVAAALRHSPDYSVTLAQSFAFPFG